MIQSVTMYTYETDDPEIAVEEIAEQLSKITLLKNSAGILMCDTEYVDSGVYTAVATALPFPIAGTTTMTQAVNGEAGMMMLTIMVLTSDDVNFEVGVTKPISETEDITEPVKDALTASLAKLPDVPKLILAFPPLFADIAGDQYIEVFNELCPGTPVFGSIAIDDSITFEKCSTFYNGEHSLTEMSYILLSGNVSPRFLIATVSDKNKLPYTGEITKSTGHIVEEINHMSAREYMESIDFAQDGKLDEGLQFVPFLLDFKNRADYDEVPVIRAMLALDEEGRGICRGYMDQGAVFTLISASSMDVIGTSLELMDKIVQIPDKQAVLVFSCMVRRMSFGVKPLTEATMVAEKLSDKSPFMLAYSGGELCPTSSDKTHLANRFHNYSIIACIL
ncbi:hypothetical protein FACS1894111_07640 [Clostridia bacterium]|nr:hypothetical protein FACS1894111_07640 [Clostridia bacterium]